jgi:hypothetical protein
MRSLVLGLGIIALVFAVGLGCTPRTYQTKTTATTTTIVVEMKKQELLVSWDELNRCDRIVEAEARLTCYVSLMRRLERARQAHNEGAEKYNAYFQAVQAKACAVYKEIGREQDAPEVCGFAKVEAVPIELEVHVCQICPSVKFFDRRTGKENVYPAGWGLELVEERSGGEVKKWFQLNIDGEDIGVRLEKQFQKYLITHENGVFEVVELVGTVDCGTPTTPSTP